jgi:HTH-type transcriptional regulator, competence development regulator
MQSFGEYIRSLRLGQKLLLREVAASLEVDPSYLSRIEGDLKRPTRDQVVRLAAILSVKEAELVIHYLSDHVAYQLRDEGLAIAAIKAAEKKVRYMQKRGKRSR